MFKHLSNNNLSAIQNFIYYEETFTLFAIMLMAITVSAKDIYFDSEDGWTKNGRTYTQTIDGVTFTVSYNSWTEDKSLSSLAFAWGWNDDYDEDEDEALPGEVTLTVSSENASFTDVDISAILKTEESDDVIEYTSNEVGSWKFTIPVMAVLKFETLVAHIQDTPTGITEVNATSSQKLVKFLKDGKLVIIKDGKKYNVVGQQM